MRAPGWSEPSWEPAAGRRWESRSGASAGRCAGCAGLADASGCPDRAGGAVLFRGSAPAGGTDPARSTSRAVGPDRVCPLAVASGAYGVVKAVRKPTNV